jgi:hypothetical protein
VSLALFSFLIFLAFRLARAILAFWHLNSFANASFGVFAPVSQLRNFSRRNDWFSRKML